MKVSAINRMLPLAVATLAMLSFSACNRGVGCPSNFSLNDFLYNAVQVVLSAIF